MFEPTRRPRVPRPFDHLPRLVVALLCLLGGAQPGCAQEGVGQTSKLPLPRFATTRSTPINVRLGPGQKYDVAWIYVKAGVPVEIEQEFDTWRKIRDIDGGEGWVHQNLLQGNRSGYVQPPEGEDSTLRASQTDDSSPRAILGRGLRVTIKQCDGSWCEVTALAQAEGERSASYSGFLHQGEIWGVFPDEVFD